MKDFHRAVTTGSLPFTHGGTVNLLTTQLPFVNRHGIRSP